MQPADGFERLLHGSGRIGTAARDGKRQNRADHERGRWRRQPAARGRSTTVPMSAEQAIAAPVFGKCST
jgi:hypothetical protein